MGWGLFRLGRGAGRLPDVKVPEPTGITVEVLNGTGRAGLARVATRVLRQEGFDVLYFGTANHPVQRTEILVRRGDSSAAERVARVLGVGRVRVALDTLLRLDVTVLLGDDYPARR
ncbi:MAG: LytR C-terminal domain-containing protein [Gemmatimonadales bacterium]